MRSYWPAWVEEKTKSVGELLRRDGYSGPAAPVITCLDAASSVGGHADVLIAEVAKACRHNSGDPV